MPVISEIEELWQEDCCEFKASLVYIVSSRPVWAIDVRPMQTDLLNGLINKNLEPDIGVKI